MFHLKKHKTQELIFLFVCLIALAASICGRKWIT